MILHLVSSELHYAEITSVKCMVYKMPGAYGFGNKLNLVIYFCRSINNIYDLHSFN